MSQTSVNHRFIACLCALALVSGWAPATAQKTSPPLAKPAAAGSPRLEEANEASATKQVGEATDNELAGTSWRLVKIMSMDDRVYEPVDTSSRRLGIPCRPDRGASLLEESP